VRIFFITSAVCAAVVAVALPLSFALATQSHEVQPGETLSMIAEDYGTTVDELASLNDILNPDHILAGQLLVIGALPGEAAGTDLQPPPVIEYVVVPGDTVSIIANRFGISVELLIDTNVIADPDHIVIGQTLLIPDVDAMPAGDAAVATHDEAEAALRAAAAEFGVDTSLLLALAWQESGWQQHVVSHANAWGVMQIIPETAEWVTLYLVDGAEDWQTNVHSNARVGAATLAHYLWLEDGDVVRALAAYYQGWYGMRTEGIYNETALYIENILYLQANLFQ
jgi:LysM repeat protein